ncbi:UNVERIFIED_ORG: hypothetical protein GGI57_000462 [Rhizobium aethiopicum]
MIVAIKHRIRETREPWTDPNHTHTKPPKDSRPVYLGEFDLPRGYLTPCPCCSPNNLKFGAGKIAWFPDEQVLRLIGPQCFRTLNVELHEAALLQWEKEKKETEARDYLLHRRDLVQTWLAAADEMVAMSREADRFFPALKNLFENRAGVPLYSAIREGFLHVWIEESELRFNDKGEPYTKVVTKLVIHGVVTGAESFKPNRKQLQVLISQARAALAQAGAFSEEYVTNASLDEKNRIAKMMRTSLQTIKQCRAVLETDCFFLRTENLQNIRGWASRPNAQLQFELGFGDGRITVTKNGDSHSIIVPEALRVRVPPTFEIP